MHEILTVATYLVAWLVCAWFIGIKSGLIKLIISLSAAVSVYVIIAVKNYKEQKDKSNEP